MTGGGGWKLLEVVAVVVMRVLGVGFMVMRVRVQGSC